MVTRCSSVEDFTFHRPLPSLPRPTFPPRTFSSEARRPNTRKETVGTNRAHGEFSKVTRPPARFITRASNVSAWRCFPASSLPRHHPAERRSRDKNDVEKGRLRAPGEVVPSVRHDKCFLRTLLTTFSHVESLISSPNRGRPTMLSGGSVNEISLIMFFLNSETRGWQLKGEVS